MERICSLAQDWLRAGRHHRLAVLLLLVLSLTFSLPATLVPRMSLEEIVDASESIVHGTVVKTWPAWDDDHKYIWTHYEVQVADHLKGVPSATIVISEPGGTVGDTALQVAGAPRYETGEEVVLFVARTPLGYLRTCGWGQGKFRVVRSGQSGKATVRAGAKGMQLVERPSGEQNTLTKGTPLGAVDGLELDQFKARVRQLVEQRPSKTSR